MFLCRAERRCCCKGDLDEVADGNEPASLMQDERFQPVLGSAGYPIKVVHPQSDSADLEERPETIVEGGAKYVGQWKGSVRHGYGVITQPDGSRYEGVFHEGQAHGEGKFVASNGNRYEGQWVGNRAHGEGTYNHNDGSTYKGQFAEDEKSGKGVERWADGCTYEGEFHFGCKHGHGIYKSNSQTIVYDGQFHNDKMEGLGTYKLQMVESTPGSGWEARCTERAAWIGPMVQDTLATSRRIFVMVQAISHGLTAECFRADGSMESKSLSHRMARIMRQMKATGPRTDACLRAEVAIYFSTKTIHRSCLVVTFVLPAECTDVVPRKSKPQIQIVLPADTAFHQACTKAIFSSRWSDVVMDRLPSSAAAIVDSGGSECTLKRA
eukprot:CAMPEP_0178416990 /NCGR_PEP_ID=MMETSP0689_2-20121128/24347_1 /TAXON_ID=160604 /ORGANISM="Amphidinium massartii, Strain CS-259" /LENGTH=380 /DNA_ID=CAMNT_0020038349 /DNA_START=164 /DNA_END=1304 /DNA_ORIENTATION=+